MPEIIKNNSVPAFDIEVWRKAKRKLLENERIQIFQCPLKTNEIAPFQIGNDIRKFSACMKLRFSDLTVKKEVTGQPLEQEDFSVMYGPEWYNGGSLISINSINYFNFGNFDEYKIFCLRKEALEGMIKEANNSLGSEDNIYYLRAFTYKSDDDNLYHAFFYLEPVENESIFDGLSLESNKIMIDKQQFLQIEIINDDIKRLMPFSCGSRIPPDPEQ